MKRSLQFVLSAALSVALVVNTIPFSLQIDDGNFQVKENNAHAVAPLVYSSAFFAELAAATGLTQSQLVATLVGIGTVSTGVAFANENGVSMSATFENNLSNLLDAADFTPWDDLSSQDQEAWGSRENYETAKLNSLMSAFGLGDARDRFYSTGGSGFDFYAEEQEIASKIGAIGNNWAIRAANTWEDISSVLKPNAQSVFTNYIGKSDAALTDITKIEDYPASCPVNPIVGKTSTISFVTNDGSNKYWTISTVPETYCTIYYYTGTTSAYRQIVVELFSKENFVCGWDNSRSDFPTPNMNTNASKSSYNNQDYYYKEFSFASSFNTYSSNVPWNNGDTYYTNNFQAAIPRLLFSGQLDSIGVVQKDVSGYPQVIDNSQNIYYPPEIEPGMNWDDFLSAMEPVYTGLDRVIQLLEQIRNLIAAWFAVDTAQDIIGSFDFSKVGDGAEVIADELSMVAPFGFVHLISDLVVIFTNVAPIQDPSFTIPFQFGGYENQYLEVDLSWLDDLKPAINAFCLISLVAGLVIASVKIVELEAAT